MSTYPVGNVIIARFAFTSRALTSAEQATFLAGGGLPANIGISPTTVLFDYDPPTLAPQTMSGSSIINDAAGAYHVHLTLDTAGLWRYRARGLDGSGLPLASTDDYIVSASRSFP